MLLDEPISEIGPLSIVGIKTMIFDLKNHSIGILKTDQNVHKIVELIDRAYAIHNRSIVFHAGPQEMLSDGIVGEIYWAE